MNRHLELINNYQAIIWYRMYVTKKF